MLKRIPWILALLVLPTAALADKKANDPLDNWPHWRGPLATGEAPRANPPLKWDEKTNVQWKVSIPGKGSSTPIVWGDQIFVTTTVDTGKEAPAKDIPKYDRTKLTMVGKKLIPELPKTYHKYIVMCLDRKNGKVLWQKTATKQVPHEGHHSTHSHCAGSPTTDGKHLYVSFGSRGIYCYDFKGNLKWKKDLGPLFTRYGWGEANTPTIHKGSLVVPWDHEGQSMLYVLNAKTGEVKWKAKRDEPTNWATSLVVKHKGITQVVIPGTNYIRSYNLTNGKVIWKCGPLTVNAIPSPVARNGVVYCMSGYRGAYVYAIPLDSKGDVSKSPAIAWKKNRNTPYITSPLLYGNCLYYMKFWSPIVTCVNAKTGKEIYNSRIPNLNKLYGSPVGAAGRIYLVDRDGRTAVFKQDAKKLNVLAINELDANIDASPALVGNQIFLRSHTHLYCIQGRQ